ncbi:MAG: ribonuclease J [Patescibacteria group bacterium]|jgi:ribonuclease J
MKKEQPNRLRQKVQEKTTNALRIIPLGGQEEVGRNMTLFEYGKDIVILDMGLQFPEEDMLGVDYIIPNITYLRGKEKNIRGVIFSHGHLDHIGAAPLLLERLGNPLVIGRPLTLALLKNRQEDYKKGSVKRLKTLTIKSISDTLRLGNFTVKFFPVDHSIMDAVGVILETPHGSAVHLGDWTYEKDPVGRRGVEYTHLSRLRKPTIVMLESLGSTNTRERVSEQMMFTNIEKLIQGAPGRVIIGTFSSQIERIKHILEYAQRIGKKVALDGYSMKVNIETAKKLGYIKVAQHVLITPEQVDKYPDEKVVIICTGAQGESNAVLSRIVTGNHRSIRIKKTDTIIFSSSVIPGNERTIQRLKDSLYRLCDNVVHSDIMDIHSSGHSTARDMLTVLKQIRPSYFVPVYANHYFLKEAEKLAVRHGFPKEHVFVLDNGSVLEFNNGKAQILPKKVPTDYVFVDGLGVGDISHVVLRDRQTLAGDGMVVIIVTVDAKTGKLVGNPDIISRGFVHMKTSTRLIDETKKKIQTMFQQRDPQSKANDAYIANKLRDDIGQFLFSRTNRRPMILPVVIDV